MSHMIDMVIRNIVMKDSLVQDIYQYDLSDPYDRLEYQLDLDAQMRDRINPNPGIQLDRDLGQYDGGAEWVNDYQSLRSSLEL